MWKYILPLVLLFFSCSVDKEKVKGIYESKSGNQITISCYNQFGSEKPFNQSNMPAEGQEITVIVNEENYDVCFLLDNVYTSFGKWNPDKRELIIQGVKYRWKKEAKCEAQQFDIRF